MSSSFVTTFLAMIGMTSGHTNRLWRSRLVNGVSDLLRTPRIHGRFATSQGDAAMAGLRVLLKLHHGPHPWDDLWRAIAVEHPLRDEWWEDRTMVPLFDRIQVPAYLGCDWENVPLHLPGSLAVTEALLAGHPDVRVARLGDRGISWPWESMHIEALAWFDHWLKGRDTGILDGPRVRYQLRKGETDGWPAAGTWPVPGVALRELALRADGTLAVQEGEPGERASMTLGAGLNRARASEADPQVSYRIPVVGTGYRLAAGHRLRLMLTSDDQNPDYPAMMTFRHASVGTSTLNRIASTSRLPLPVSAGTLS